MLGVTRDRRGPGRPRSAPDPADVSARRHGASAHDARAAVGLRWAIGRRAYAPAGTELSHHLQAWDVLTSHRSRRQEPVRRRGWRRRGSTATGARWVRGAGDLVGEMAFLLDQPRTADVLVRAPGRALISRAQRSGSWIDSDTALAAKLLLNVSGCSPGRSWSACRSPHPPLSSTSGAGSSGCGRSPAGT